VGPFTNGSNIKKNGIMPFREEQELLTINKITNERM
jgi:hypothetical protein